MYVNKTDLLVEIYNEIDEAPSNSYFSEESVIRYANRELDWLSSNVPIRLARFSITGDGKRRDYFLPEPVNAIIAVTQTNSFVLPRNIFELAAQNAFRTTLASDIYASYGVAFYPPNKLLFGEVLGSSETRVVWAYGHCGHMKTTTGQLVESALGVTEDSPVVTNVTNASEVKELDSFTITDSNGVTEIYVVRSVDTANLEVTLTENFRGTTGTATGVIAEDVIVPIDYLDFIVYGVLSRLAAKEKDTERQLLYRQYYNAEKRTIRGRLERIRSINRQQVGRL